MIPLLLWRCPICATNDALVHVSRRLRPDLVRCGHCSAEWRVRRAPGDNFYLKLVQPTSGTGSEHSITEWYDAMKQTVHLVPIHDPEVSLLPNEVLYLASGLAELQAEETDPLFFPIRECAEAAHVDKRQVRGKMAGTGRLFLTNRRLIWQGKGLPRYFPLNRVNSAYALMDFGLLLMVEMRLYTLYFLEESLLKWVTYLALVARNVQMETGHRVTTSHF